MDSYLYPFYLDAFKKLDKSGKGFVSKDDWENSAARTTKATGIKFTKMQMSGMWGYLDSNGDGQIDFKELQAATGNNEAKNRLVDILSIFPFPFLLLSISICVKYR